MNKVPSQVAHRVGLPPVIGGSPRVLMLGTIPSVISDRRGQYYGNPRNHFWRLMAEVLDIGMPSDYTERCEVLVKGGIALWDVLAECDIRGSGDHTITNPVPNDIASLLRAHDSVRQVFINGRTAFKLYRRFHEGAFSGKVTGLPSSSPANAMRWADRCKEWAVIRDAL